MSKEKYHNLSNEEREQQARDYVESQAPIVAEDPIILNPAGGNVPEEEYEEGDEAKPRRKKGRGK